MVNQTDIEILTDTFSALQNTKKWFLECHLPVYMHVYIDTDMSYSPMPEELSSYYSYLVPNSLSIIGG